MVRGECVLENRARTLIQLRRCFVLSQPFQQHRQVVERHRHVGMLRSKLLLLDGERAAVKFFRFRQPAPRIFERGQVVQIDGDLIMFRPVRALEARQRPPVERFRFVILALSVQNRGQRGEVCRYIHVLRAERPLPNLDRAARQRFPGGKVSTGVCQPAEVVIDRGDLRVFQSE